MLEQVQKHMMISFLRLFMVLVDPLRKKNFCGGLKERVTYESVFSFFTQTRDLIGCCTEKKEIFFANLLSYLHISPIKCSYDKATIESEFHIACTTCLHACCADVLRKLTSGYKHLCYSHIVVWNKYNLEMQIIIYSYFRRKKKTCSEQ